MSEGSLPESEIFGRAYKDWQAIRIIRDNYFDIWKTFLTFYSWFAATMVGVGGYIISNQPFTIPASRIIGWIGVALIINVLLILILMAFILRRYIRNLHSILERGGDLPFMQDKLLNTRTASIVAASCACGLAVGLFAWTYLMFFYYASRG